MEIKTGVYEIFNTLTKKRYIGSTAAGPVENRILGHIRGLRNNKHVNRHLQNSWNRYGEEVFVFRVLERCIPKNCLIREQFYIDKFDSANSKKGYNIAPKAENTRGVVHPPEIRAKMSEAIRKAYLRPEVKELRRKVFSSEEYKKNAAKSRANYINTPEYRRKLSEAGKKAQNRPEVKARVLAGLKTALSKPEYREKQRIASTGRKHTEETIQKMREANTAEVRFKKGSPNRGKKLSEETKAKMRKPKSEEARKNMRLAATKGWIKRKAKLTSISSQEDPHRYSS